VYLEFPVRLVSRKKDVHLEFSVCLVSRKKERIPNEKNTREKDFVKGLKTNSEFVIQNIRSDRREKCKKKIGIKI